MLGDTYKAAGVDRDAAEEVKRIVLDNRADMVAKIHADGDPDVLGIP